jgi:8-oxo-dGTP diphosphatase
MNSGNFGASIAVAAAVIRRPDGHILLGRRPLGSVFAHHWEFPGGKVEAGETPLEALHRELAEELGIRAIQVRPWVVRHHSYPHACVRLHFFIVDRWEGALQPLVHNALSWENPSLVKVSPLLPANGPLLSALSLPSFYGITHAAALGIDAQIKQLDYALGQGLSLVLLREPGLNSDGQQRFYRQALKQCQDIGVPCLLHSHIDLAQGLGADGVHLRAAQLAQVNDRPAFKLVAASCHNRAELERASALPVDFAVLGPVAPTTSHPKAAGLGWKGFSRLVEGLPIPVYALGGMRREDIATAHAHGAHGVAAVRSAWVRPSDMTSAL